MGYFLRLFWYGSVLAGVAWLLLTIVEFSDIYKVIHRNVPGPCKFVGGVEDGAEDIAVLPNGIAILSTGLQFSRPNGLADQNVKPGALMTFDFSSPGLAAKTLKLSGFKGELNPHGISLFTESGKTYVYVVNHPKFNEPPPADVVEKFLWDVERETLVHQKTFSDPHFLGLNDLVVVGVDQFYITNLMTMTSKILRDLEMLLFAVPLQNVVYFDGKEGTVVLNGLYGPNGIEISTDKKFLFLAEVTKKRISSFRIESPKNLTLVDSKSLGTIPDNVVIDRETGDLWIGCHPLALEILKKLFGWVKTSSSQVLRVSVSEGKFTSGAEIYADDGSVLSASTVAVPYKGALLIGTANHKLLHCKLVGLNSIMKLK